MSNDRKFSIAIRIDAVNPVHTRMSVFCAMVLKEYAHTSVTRGKAGDLVMRNEEIIPFIGMLEPHILTHRSEVPMDLIVKYTGLSSIDFDKLDDWRIDNG